MRWFATFGPIVLGLTCVGCGSPTREAAAEEQVTRAIDAPRSVVGEGGPARCST